MRIAYFIRLHQHSTQFLVRSLILLSDEFEATNSFPPIITKTLMNKVALQGVSWLPSIVPWCDLEKVCKLFQYLETRNSWFIFACVLFIQTITLYPDTSDFNELWPKHSFWFFSRYRTCVRLSQNSNCISRVVEQRKKNSIGQNYDGFS